MHSANLPTAWVETYEENGLVTDWYIKSIGDMISGMGIPVQYVSDCTHNGNPKRDLYFVSEAKSAMVLAAKGCRNLIYWAQGLAPEEDYLRFDSKPRRFALGVCEKTALRRAKRIFMVSDAMCRHFEMKYSLDLASKTFVAPCCNEVLHPESFLTPGKYQHPVFTYAGGLSKYQCIDGMLGLFADIQARIPDAELLFYTWDTEKANELVNALGLPNVSVATKKQDELSGALSRAKYGFVIRDDIAVNRVATPTKISTYMSNGVIPVVSSCVEAFAEASYGLKHAICCHDVDMIGAICDMERQKIDASEILSEYRGFFDGYFDFGKKRNAMSEFLAPMAHDMGF